MKPSVLTLFFVVACGASKSDTAQEGGGVVGDTGPAVPDCASPEQFYYDADGDGYGDEGILTLACEMPAHHVSLGGDCDDIDPAVHPDAEEVCNDRDDNCDGVGDEELEELFYADVDGDGFGDPDSALRACLAPSGHVNNNADCDDDSAEVNPDAAESCNGVDDNCDDQVDEEVLLSLYVDEDGDLYGDPSREELACEETEGLVADGSDCDDTDANVNPDAIENCNEVDDDCDGDVDEDLRITYYTDADSDGYGDPLSVQTDCFPPDDAVLNGDDCDDTDADVRPGAVEECDEEDDNCDGVIDEGLTSTFFVDFDLDGYGDPESTVEACEASAGMVSNGDDCLDVDGSVHPDGIEVCNEQDDDCDDAIDEGVTLTFYADLDDDGYGDPETTIEACELPDGASENAEDCSDESDTVHPGAEEVCNEVDDDCDDRVDEDAGISFYFDLDGDTFGGPGDAVVACSAPSPEMVDNNLDCNDDNVAVHPDATEVCNEIDDNCDDAVDEGVTSAFYTDADGDGYGAVESEVWACSAPADTIADGSDCDDTQPLVFPGASESCNGIDDDCDSSVDEDWESRLLYLDSDGDGHGSPEVTDHNCGLEGWVEDDEDCDDSESEVYPGALETIDGLDNDCNGEVDDLDVASADVIISGIDLTDLGLTIRGGADIDSDGTADLLVRGEEQIWLFSGPILDDVDTTEATLSLYSDDAADEFGESFDTLDFDGDGYQDVIVAADSAAFGGAPLIGAAYLFLGPTVADREAAGADVTIGGPAPDGTFASLVRNGGSHAGGDGSECVLVSTTAKDTTTGNTVHVFEFVDPLVTSLTTTDEVSRYTSHTAADGFGSVVANVGDLDDDGHDDVLFGAPDGGDGAGVAYLFYGPPSAEMSTSDADVSFYGDLEEGRFGAAVAGGGDVDGDGTADMAISDPAAHDDGGRVFVVLSSTVMSDAEIGTVATSVLSDGRDSMGLTLAMGGDVNGDSYDDVIVGAPEASGTWDVGGHASLFYGGTIGSVDEADAGVRATRAGQQVGLSVTFLGDPNGDLLEDFAVGAIGEEAEAIDVDSGAFSADSTPGTVFLFYSDY